MTLEIKRSSLSSQSNSFTTIQTDIGTYPTASTSSDILTLTSSDASVEITGDSSTDTIDIKVAGAGTPHDPVTVTDSAEIDFTLTGQDITASIKNGSIDESKLDASVNASLDLADSASQPGHTHTASDITDFDTEVSNNTDVAANTSARHDAVTVTDSSEIDFTLTGQNITASIISGSIDESKLDASVNASLDLADSASQPGHTHTSNQITDLIISIEASEDLVAGNYVNIYDSTGAKVRKADNSNGRAAHGFVKANVTTGQNATIYSLGVDNNQSSLTIGGRCYLSTNGTVTQTAPTSAGGAIISQYLGLAISATEINTAIADTIGLV